MHAATINPAHIKQVYNALKIFHPEILEDIKPKLVKPEPVFKHAVLLPVLLKRFCELREVSQASIIGTYKGQEAVDHKELFIAIVIKLYDPQLLTGVHTEIMRNNLSEELSGLLQTERSWVSQVTTKVRTILNPYRLRPAYQDFKEEVDRLAKVLEIEFGK